MATKIKIKKKKEAALYVRKEPRAIRKWEKAGRLKKGEDGCYDPEQLDKCLRFYSQRETQKAIDAVTQVEKIQVKFEQLRVNFTKGLESVTTAMVDLTAELKQIQEQVNAALVQKLIKSF
jgi:hypothetical protein